LRFVEHGMDGCLQIGRINCGCVRRSMSMMLGAGRAVLSWLFIVFYTWLLGTRAAKIASVS
jgi:hypothetical protein